MITTCPVCRNGVSNSEQITHTAAGWVHSCCASGDGPARTGKTITNHLYHYVTARYDSQTAILLGPYPDHETALANVHLGKRLAIAGGDPRADFAGYGTASSNRQLRTAFGK